MRLDLPRASFQPRWTLQWCLLAAAAALTRLQTRATNCTAAGTLLTSGRWKTVRRAKSRFVGGETLSIQFVRISAVLAHSNKACIKVPSDELHKQHR